ncbi:MAG: sulfite exporter TauE/SafE family protein [Gammaproteobacteria bacterium]|nr:MAG: sulfite exporter TauE/SafE family protein [Gammaproteobacteria bacterium]
MEAGLTLPAAFIVGLLGGVHCIGMCGGIVAALTGSVDSGIRASRGRFLVTLLAYNTGRIFSYTLAGVFLGLLGQQVDLLEPLTGFPVARVFSGVFMLLLGVYLAGWWPALRWLEQAGTHIWKRIEPLGRRYLPIRHSGQALILGMLWGWLPCGMVYAVLALALASGSTLNGGLTMLAFGLGTLPLMLAMGVAFSTLARRLQGRIIRALAGITVMLFGIYTLVMVPADHRPHGEHGLHQHVHPPAIPAGF